MRLALVVALAACGATQALPPLGHTSDPAQATPPAPTVAWRDGAFVPARLPAVARDGAVVVLAISDGDGERGFANLRFSVRGRDDREVNGHVVLAAADGDAMFDADGPTAALRGKLDAGNTWLASQHARLQLVPLAMLAVVTGEAVASADGITLAWRTGRIDRVEIRDRAGRLVERVIPTAWLQPAGATTGCTYRPVLVGAAVAVAQRVAVVTIAHTADERCATAAAEPHVIAW